MAIITLTTDFGWADYYVAAMKGIILQIAPGTTIVDVTHELPRHDLMAGALVLRELFRAFGPKTIHVAVADPGVRSTRKIVLVQYGQQFFLTPDNGLVTLVQQLAPPVRAWSVENAGLFCQPVSPTFHGRDIFAPVAAHLSKGLRPEQVGPPTDYLVLLDVPVPQASVGRLAGQVIHVDRFGNLLTNIGVDHLQELGRSGRGLEVVVGDRAIGAIRRTFADVPSGEVLAYIGSAGLLEVAVSQGSAAQALAARAGTEAEVRVIGS